MCVCVCVHVCACVCVRVCACVGDGVYVVCEGKMAGTHSAMRCVAILDS